MFKNQQLNYSFVMILSGSICCMLVGFIFFGAKIFAIEKVFFQFTTYGVVGSISFALFKIKRFRDAFFVLILLFLFNMIIAGTKNILTHLLFFGSVIASTYIFSSYFLSELGNRILARPLVLAGILSILYVIITILLGLFYQSETTNFSPFMNMPIGFLIGLGLGFGFEVADFINSKVMTDFKN